MNPHNRVLSFLFSAVSATFLIPNTSSAAEEKIFMYNSFGQLKHDDAFEEYLRIHRPNARFYRHVVNPDNEDQMRDVIADIRKHRPSLIYSWGTPVTLRLAGKMDDFDKRSGDYIHDIPIVFVSVTQPVASGMVRNLENPNRNMTGTVHIAPIPLQLKTIRQYRPFSKLGIVYNPREPNSVWVKDALIDLAKNEKFTLLAYSVPVDANGKLQSEAIPDLLRKIKSQGAEWLYLGPDTYVAGFHRKTVVDVCWDIGLPIFAVTEGPVSESKALLGLFVHHQHLGAHAARKAKLILEGKNPGSIPIDSPQQFSLVINMDAAEHYGLLPPAGMLDIAEIARPLTQGKIK